MRLLTNDRDDSDNDGNDDNELCGPFLAQAISMETLELIDAEFAVVVSVVSAHSRFGLISRRGGRYGVRHI